MEIKLLSGALGAEIEGIDLKDSSIENCNKINNLLLEHKVLFFRNQNISPEQHIDLAKFFGPLEKHVYVKGLDKHPEIIRIIKGANEKHQWGETWHTDVSYNVKPTKVIILRSIKIPPVGGATFFVDANAAYEGLPQEIKQKIDSLHAVHDFLRAFGRQTPKDKHDEIREKYPLVEHPVVINHHQTGKPLLYVNRIFVTAIEGLNEKEGYELIDLLCREFEILEYSCRFRWEPDSIAFWDNQAVQHYAASDYSPHVRVMERASIKGTRPKRTQR